MCINIEVLTVLLGKMLLCNIYSKTKFYKIKNKSLQSYFLREFCSLISLLKILFTYTSTDNLRKKAIEERILT